MSQISQLVTIQPNPWMDPTKVHLDSFIFNAKFPRRPTAETSRISFSFRYSFCR